MIGNRFNKGTQRPRHHQTVAKFTQFKNREAVRKSGTKLAGVNPSELMSNSHEKIATRRGDLLPILRTVKRLNKTK